MCKGSCRRSRLRDCYRLSNPLSHLTVTAPLGHSRGAFFRFFANAQNDRLRVVCHSERSEESLLQILQFYKFLYHFGVGYAVVVVFSGVMCVGAVHYLEHDLAHIVLKML